MARQRTTLEQQLWDVALLVRAQGRDHFLRMAMALEAAQSTNIKVTTERREIDKLLRRARRLTLDLEEFWNRYPRFANLVTTL